MANLMVIMKIQLIKHTTMQNKTPYNEEGQRDGYWELYHFNGQLADKGLYINNKAFGYHESYFSNGAIVCKGHFINNQICGYFENSYNKTHYYAK
jgi:antitoxin component YwqK of YwqJK toxin-antitoxin module